MQWCYIPQSIITAIFGIIDLKKTGYKVEKKLIAKDF